MKGRPRECGRLGERAGGRVVAGGQEDAAVHGGLGLVSGQNFLPAAARAADGQMLAQDPELFGRLSLIARPSCR